MDDEINPLDNLPGSSELWDIAEALYENDRKRNPQFGPWQLLLRRANDDPDPRYDRTSFGPKVAEAALRSVAGYLEEARVAVQAIALMSYDMKLAGIARVKGAIEYKTMAEDIDEEVVAAEVWHGAIGVILKDSEPDPRAATKAALLAGERPPHRGGDC